MSQTDPAGPTYWLSTQPFLPMPIFQLDPHSHQFPSPYLAEPDGLLAVGGDLSPGRLLAAYQQGVFPWFGDHDPILWWSPAPRLVLFPQKIHLSRRLQRSLRVHPFTLRADSAFDQVVDACASSTPERRQAGGSWLTAAMRLAYGRLHILGFAHSVECWRGQRLVGGLYGLCLDKMFFGESMFSLETNASKAALAALAHHAGHLGIACIDCQMTTEHLLRLGAEEVNRHTFMNLLRTHISKVRSQQKWRLPLTGKEGNGAADARGEKERGI